MKALRIIILVIAIIAVGLLLLAGPGTRMDWWDFRFGFTMMEWALYGGVAAGILGILLLLIPATRRGGATVLVAAVVIGLTTAAVPYLQVQKARSVPPIHDITTDTADPPEFVAIAPLRADAPNPVEYPGEETAEKQRDHYPDIRTLQLDAWPAIAFEHALEAARAQGWEIVEASEAEGRIEATATTFWFGFKDDVVIRIRGDNNGSAIDVRSKSRVGQSDVGANAARIKAYLEDLQARSQS
ncbi:MULTISPECIES: DUF1499 domain-containing protein [unclassified Wenzhouxiangella]|uniref:DUF1499 domain-containing protein n=1 Tax=unclassified Wenzhouxiangella TaxID=2613841 RepID=UPI000E32B5B9|nr:MULTISPECIES: DUF1499 domain-containing protein [unclassified Wenzhouxiangella]RFF26311.1 DUF1499 domain-containing protein [Wenzhouxiangella sp. 15181]RFP67417.1 DUF1499 domain-containing protein [Wenzhouxiangella sp. 15190]